MLLSKKQQKAGRRAGGGPLGRPGTRHDSGQKHRTCASGDSCQTPAVSAPKDRTQSGTRPLASGRLVPAGSQDEGMGASQAVAQGRVGGHLGRAHASAELSAGGGAGSKRNARTKAPRPVFRRRRFGSSSFFTWQSSLSVSLVHAHATPATSPLRPGTVRSVRWVRWVRSVDPHTRQATDAAGNRKNNYASRLLAGSVTTHSRLPRRP